MTEPKVKEIKTEKPPAPNNEVINLLKGVADSIGTLAARVDGMQDEIVAMKTGNKDAFKKEAKSADITAAESGRKGVDPKIVQIVDELLGVDFGIELAPLGDRPGFLFTLIVPDRLNDNVLDMRPVRSESNPNEYKKDQFGRVVMQEYKLPYHSSRILSTADGYDAIRQHCERVRAYIVAYYTKLSRPVPELKVQ